MPVPVLFGAVASRTSGSAGFVTEHHYVPAGATQAVSFSGASAGNLAVVVVSNSTGSAPPIPAGWTRILNYTWITYGYNETAYYKLLSAGDISTGSVTFTGLNTDAHVMALFYSGPTVAAVATFADGATATVTATGFTKNASCKAIITWCTTRQPAATPAAPGTTVSRIANYLSVNFKASASDIINPSNYVDGSDLAYTGCGTIAAVVGVIELT